MILVLQNLWCFQMCVKIIFQGTFTSPKNANSCTPGHFCLLWLLRRWNQQKMRILTLKLKTSSDPEKVFRGTRRVLLHPNDCSWTFFAFWIELQRKNLKPQIHPKMRVVGSPKIVNFDDNFRDLQKSTVSMSWLPWWHEDRKLWESVF